MLTAQDIINFWFNEIEPASWWRKDLQFDRLLSQKFLQLHSAAASCELYTWRNTAHGRLAEIIILDQFSRNLFRDSAKAFAFDAQALVLAQEAIAMGTEKSLSTIEQSFLYMPFMHSESLKIHERAVELFTVLGNEGNLAFELKHKAIIERFGRYPHRNIMLGRTSTADELEFLTQPGSSF
jgi:uncharacterized protein (DUF924 family)